MKTQTIPLTIYLLTLAVFSIGVIEFLPGGLSLIMARELDTSVANIGFFITIYALGGAIGGPIMTIIMNRFPRKLALLSLYGIFVIGNIFFCLATYYPFLLISRFITALSHGAFFGIGMILASQMVPEGKKGQAIALFFLGLNLASVIGLPLGIYFAELFGTFRIPFVMITGLSFMIFLLLLKGLPNQRSVVHSASLKQQLPYLNNRKLKAAFSASIILFVSVYIFFSYVPSVVVAAGVSEDFVKYASFLLGLSGIVGNFFGGWLANKQNLGRVIPTSFAVFGAWLFCISAVAYMEWTVLALVLIVTLPLIGFALGTPLTAWIIRNSGESADLANTINVTFIFMGIALGAFIGGLVLDYFQWGGWLPFAAGVFAWLASFVFVKMK